jgi:hypothetical protein
VRLGCLSTRACDAPMHARLQELCAAPGRVCLQEPALNLCVLSSRALFCTWTCLSTRVCAAPVRVYLEEICAAPGRACLQEPVLQLCIYIYMHICLQEHSPLCTCRCTVSKQVCLCSLFRYMFETPKQTETNQKRLFFGFVKQTEKQPKRCSFGSFRTNRTYFLFVSRTP